MPNTKIAIIGAGQVGQTLACCWAQHHVAHIVTVCNRSLKSGQRACEIIGSGQACTQLAELPEADVYAIFTPDDAIAQTCQDLAKTVPLSGKTVIHASGLHPASILTAAQQTGAAIASIHPVKAFADTAMAVQTFAGTYCGIEGDTTALTLITPLLKAIGAIVFVIDASQKAAYHGACVIAANFTVTLKHLAMQAFAQAGLPAAVGEQLAGQLMAQALDNMQQQAPQQALTGPAKRGDQTTIAAHRKAFAQTDIAAIYNALHDATMALATHR